MYSRTPLFGLASTFFGAQFSRVGPGRSDGSCGSRLRRLRAVRSEVSLERDASAGFGNDHLRLGKLSIQLKFEPLDRGPVAVYEDDLFRSTRNRVFEQTLPAGVCAEIEFFDLTTQLHRREFGIEDDLLARMGRANAPGGRLRVGIANEEQALVFVAEHSTRKDVRKGVLGHHAAGEGEDGLLPGHPSS